MTTDNLSPVEALQREIGFATGALTYLKTLDQQDKSMETVGERVWTLERFVAALELAKAYAILREWNFDPSLDLTSAEIDAKDFALHKAESDAFTKLYEALKQ